MYDLSTFTSEAKYVIADDIEFQYFPNKKQWWGAQKTFTATDKYHRKMTIEFGRPLIYICNFDQDPRRSQYWSDWFDSNTIAVEIYSPLFIIQ